MKQRKGCRMSCDVGKAADGSQLILQPFRCFTYVIGTSPTSPGEPPMPLWWCLIYLWWFCNLQWLRPAGYMKDVNWPSNSKGWRPLLYTEPHGSGVGEHRSVHSTSRKKTEHVQHVEEFTLQTALPILQPFRHFTYITTHSPTLPSLYLRHSSFSNPSVALPTSQFILQPFFRFSYITSFSLNTPGEPPMIEP